MLKEKDYCDYDICAALEELGFPIRRIKVKGEEKHVPILLYESQKWLRNTHNLHISTKPYPCEDGLMWMYEIRQFTPYLVCVIKNKTGFQKEEEALLEGIKEVVKLLKEEK